MGFKETRRATIRALLDGRFQHEERAQSEGKNLLATGEVSVEEVVALLMCCRGNQHETDVHHFDRSQTIDIFKPVQGRTKWYIKSYLIEENGITAFFISVHR
jgi:hypothetical protein